MSLIESIAVKGKAKPISYFFYFDPLSLKVSAMVTFKVLLNNDKKYHDDGDDEEEDGAINGQYPMHRRGTFLHII